MDGKFSTHAQKVSRTNKNKNQQNIPPTTFPAHWLDRLYFSKVKFKRLSTFCHTQKNKDIFLTQKSKRVTVSCLETIPQHELARFLLWLVDMITTKGKAEILLIVRIHFHLDIYYYLLTSKGYFIIYFWNVSMELPGLYTFLMHININKKLHRTCFFYTLTTFVKYSHGGDSETELLTTKSKAAVSGSLKCQAQWA